ncbi:Rne/Rng family ribonuclease [Neobacillus sp. SM06]|uniref:Rne/Rng family ribonuclease n=1 Tax=Neobacillus sp. SM06 TaxID=3422492 RepID=UPI003D2E86FD
MKKLIVNYTAREKRFALVNDNRVESLVFDRPDQQSLVGNIYYGTVTKVLPGMNAVFIEIGEGKQAYLPRKLLASYVQSQEDRAVKEKKSLSAFVHQGEKMLVQIEKDATGTKGPKATGIIEIQGRHLIYMPQGKYVAVSKKIAGEKEKAALRAIGRQLKNEDEGLIFRTSSLDCSEEEVASELLTLRNQYRELLGKAGSFKYPGLLLQRDSFLDQVIEAAKTIPNGEVMVDDGEVKRFLETSEAVKDRAINVTFYNQKENIFAAAKIEHAVEKALKRLVWLENGAYLVFDQTEALTIIDVNTGKFSGKVDLEDTIVKTNLLAAKEAVRQLRLRDIGGMILIDFIDMANDGERKAVLKAIEQEIERDEKRIKVSGFTELGILQLTRKKTKVSLSEALEEKCPVCDGKGRVMSAETAAFKLERELLEHRHSEYEAVLIDTTAAVKEAFEGPGKDFLKQFEEMIHLKIFFSIEPNPVPFYSIRQFGTIKDIAQKGDFY